MSPTDLIVPIRLHALVYNQGVLRSQAFNRWLPTYTPMLKRQGTAEPAPGTGENNDIDGQFGVHLQWQLPESLTTGHYDPDTHRTTFPLIPNRWLIVRHHDAPDGTREAVGWVVTSDFLFSEHPTWTPPPDARFAQYVNNFAEGAPFYDSLGRADALAPQASWRDPGGTPHLTAVGPGLPAFAAFEPYHPNVLSFYDDLRDLRPSPYEPAPPNTFGYLAVGWYSSADIDVLVKAAEIPDLLPPDAHGIEDVIRALGWEPPEGVTVSPDARSHFVGTALAIPWDQDATAPPSRMPRHQDIEVAVGHSTDDAIGGLITSRSGSARDGDLLRALFHGTIDGLNGPDGLRELDDATRQTWFDGRNAGYAWEITNRPTDDDAPPTRHTRAAAPAWLAELNARQAEHDALVTRLDHACARYWTLYWLSGLPGTKPDGFVADADAQLVVDHTRIEEMRHQLGELRDDLPYGTTPEELSNAITAFLTTHPLPDGLDLKRVASEPFHRPSDPVVVIENGGADQPLTRDPDDPLPCRTPDGLVTSVYYAGQWHDAPTSPPAPNLTGDIPAVCGRLLPEFTLLDRAARTPGAAPGDSALDDILADPDALARGPIAEYTARWRQPWLPMYVQWELRYSPTPYRSQGRDNWEFDGDDYAWLGTGSPVTNEHEARLRVFRGRGFLTPTAVHVMRGQLRRLCRTFSDDAAALGGLDDDIKARDLLSQALDGLNDWLLRQDGAARRVPDATMLPFTGEGSTVPRPGAVVPPPEPEDVFQPVRAGQFFFTDLRIIDRFGRSVDIVGQYGSGDEQFDPHPARSVTPSRVLYPNAPGAQRFVQLPPRVLHEARVRFEAVDAATGTRFATGPAAADLGAPGAAVGPVGGWLLLNRLDHNLLVYAPDGAPLGELRIVTPPDGGRALAWNPLPNSPYYAHPPQSETFRAAFPQLGGFAGTLLSRPHTAFEDLLTAIDAALRSIETPDPQDDRTVARLIGRPLALVRADLTIDLNGPLLTDPSWATVLQPPREDYPTYRWPVRLGEAERLSDGLIGYYATAGEPGDPIDYGRLHAVAPVSGSAYTVPIGNGEGLALPARRTTEDPVTHALTLLVDPRAAVHASTGILPIQALRLPADLVHEALLRIGASFRLAPLLAQIRTEREDVRGARGGQPVRDGLVMPQPAQWYGTWTWAEPDLAPDDDEPTWITTPIVPADTRFHPDDPTPVARSGYLQLDPVREGRTPT
ncbi:hypothetical protein [Streptomyces noursei]|uniref:hypothetical protein n=1 Tax=Streptomyces noursei TaxID=1971 RepID=UPI001671A192|nr:hypothetical protein [Streptomyces noursei]MCZ1020332.1 hypothetical protein [Streptomyces noursei]GGX55150.1 hypothetical protein GCM10010341_90100 [Streptomyces noursei]